MMYGGVNAPNMEYGGVVETRSFDEIDRNKDGVISRVEWAYAEEEQAKKWQGEKKDTSQEGREKGQTSRDLNKKAPTVGKAPVTSSTEGAGGESQVLRYPNGDVYRGALSVDGLREGQGTCVFQSGAEYTGDWKGDVMEGYGRLKQGEESYDGEWHQGVQSGNGVYISEDGGRYEGEWQNGDRHGQGVYKYANGDHYCGEWVEGNREGSGDYRGAGDALYQGTWKGDLKFGFGTMTSNGATYVGGWEEDLYHGFGRYTQADGRERVGIWNAGKLVEKA